MVKEQKYRYSLQFGMETEEEKRAGQLMEVLGNRKSRIVVAALNEYLDNHPDLLSGEHKIQFQLRGMPQEQLEACVRRIVAEHFSTGTPGFPSGPVLSVQAETQQVSDDILEMLNDLDCFDMN